MTLVRIRSPEGLTRLELKKGNIKQQIAQYLKYDNIDFTLAKDPTAKVVHDENFTHGEIIFVVKNRLNPVIYEEFKLHPVDAYLQKQSGVMKRERNPTL